MGIMHRTDNHVTLFRCKDVAASFARRRAELVAEATRDGFKVLHDDGEQFRAEKFDSCRHRVELMACIQGYPFVNGPAIVRRDGAKEYSALLLPK
jgi:hypothetical protein